MKNLLLTVLVPFVLAGSAFAAPAKKAAAPAPDAGEWKALDNRKGHLWGPQLFEGDLYLQPVAVVVFDPGVAVTAEDKQENPKYMVVRAGEGEALPKRFQVINVPSRALTKDEVAQLPKEANKKAAVPGFAWYAGFGLQNPPEGMGNDLPFYYVVSAEGKLVYSGTQGSAAVAALDRETRKQQTCHPLLGEFTPSQTEPLCKTLEFGKDSTKTVAKLKAAAAKPDTEEGKEAVTVLRLLDQSKSYWRKTISDQLSANPPMAAIYAYQAVKTFPRDKQVFLPLLDKINANPVIAKVVKTYRQILAYKEKMPEKKGDVAKAYMLVCQAEKQCQKAQKDYGEKLPRAFMKLEELVLTVKADLEAAGAGPKK